MKANGPAVARALEQLGAFDACQLQVLSEIGRRVTRPALQRGSEDEGVRLAFAAERLESTHDTSAEGPRSRVPRLRPLEANRGVRQVDVPPPQLQRLAEPEPFARQKAVQHPRREREIGARHQLRLLGRIEVAERGALPDLRQEPGRQRIPLDQLARVDGELQQLRDELGIVTARRRGASARERGHRRPRVLEPKVSQRDVSHRLAEPGEPHHVVLDAALGANVVRVLSRELAARPAAGQLAERDQRRRLRCVTGCGAVLARERLDLAHACFGGLLAGLLQDDRRVSIQVRGNQQASERRHAIGALLRSARVGERNPETLVLPVAAAQTDSEAAFDGLDLRRLHRGCPSGAGDAAGSA